jgi:hypothetical protein
MARKPVPEPEPVKGLAALARVLLTAQPLSLSEQLDLDRLRLCKLTVPACASEREELGALRADFDRELAALRAFTEKSYPLAYPIDPVAELYWRRECAKHKRRVDEVAEEEKAVAEEEKARKKREADEERFVYLHQKKQHEARLKREAEEMQRRQAEEERQR